MSACKSRKQKFSDENKIFHYPAKWMVMGSFRLLFETALRNFASARLFTLLCIFFILLLAVQEGESKSCRVDECAAPYKRSTRRLEALEKNPTANLSKRRCRVLRKLHRCLHQQRRVCRGNLLYHSLKPVSDKELGKANCSRKSGRFSGSTRVPSVSTPVKKQKNNQTISLLTNALQTNSVKDSACLYSGKSKFSHCGMFGDPHLRTFSDVLNTCKVEGTWNLISNDYLTVMVTNVPVKNGSSATATTKITVQLNSYRLCVENHLYRATSGQLPGAFVDGSSLAGSLEVVEKEPQKVVEIYARHIGTTIIIRQVGRYLTFAIQIPKEFITNDKSVNQLCVRGCPSTDQLLPTKMMSDVRDTENSTSRQSSTKLTSTNKETNVISDEKSPVSRFYAEEDARIICKQILLEIPADEKESVNKTKTNSKKRNNSKRFGNDWIHTSFKQLRGVEEKVTEHSPRKRGKRLRNPESTTSTPTKPAQIKEKQNHNDQNKKAKDCDDKKETSFNFYFDSCVFDLMTTGDIEFAQAAKGAWDDVKRTHPLTFNAPSSSVEVITRWEPQDVSKPKCKSADSGEVKGGDGGGTRANKSTFILVFLCTLITCLSINLASIFVCDDVTVKSKKRKDTARFQNFISSNNFNTRRTT